MPYVRMLMRPPVVSVWVLHLPDIIRTITIQGMDHRHHPPVTTIRLIRTSLCTSKRSILIRIRNHRPRCMT
uniref:Putative secreted protein n=1 Tax=Anopheles marajoara TaxID=58244 RepID=A0A2M4CFI4_9DIPT